MEKKAKLNFDKDCCAAYDFSKNKGGKSQYHPQKSLVYNNIIYNLNNNIPRWKELSKVQKVDLFFTYIVDDKWIAMTLRFSDAFVAKCVGRTKITDFIRRRINENFKNKLGYVPEYMFCLEFDQNYFHIHGVIKPDNDFDVIKKVLKASAFCNRKYQKIFPEQFKLKCAMLYRAKGWGNYILKHCDHKLFDIYLCLPIIRRIAHKYNELVSIRMNRDDKV